MSSELPKRRPRPKSKSSSRSSARRSSPRAHRPEPEGPSVDPIVFKVIAGVVVLIALFIAYDNYGSKIQLGNFGGSSSEGEAISVAQVTPAPKPLAPAQPEPGTKDAVPTAAKVKLTTNAYGAHISIVDTETKEELKRHDLTGSETTWEVELPFNKQVTATARLGDEVSVETIETKEQQVSANLDFNSSSINRLQLASTCMIRTPVSFGSGFLMGDRETIATAAHCVSSPTLDELEFIFDPGTSHPEVIKGAKLIHFDRQQDVALLKLNTPASDKRPYLWGAGGDKTPGMKLTVIGNPGRDGEADPLYSRRAVIKGTRSDEFFLDIELKPGYSGGPVCDAEKPIAHGIVSYKLLGDTQRAIKADAYETIGLSFAKSAALVEDAYIHWGNLTSDSRANRIEVLRDRYQRTWKEQLAHDLAFAMIVESAAYTSICIEVFKDYKIKMAIAMAQLRTNRPTIVRRAQKRAHEEYMREDGPEIAAKVREKVSPKLDFFEQENYDLAIKGEGLNEDLKKKLIDTYTAYQTLKKAAENIVNSENKNEEDRTAEEFIEWTLEMWGDVYENGITIVESTDKDR